MPGTSYSVRGYISSWRSNELVCSITPKNLKLKDAKQGKWKNDMTNVITGDRYL